MRRTESERGEEGDTETGQTQSFHFADTLSEDSLQPFSFGQIGEHIDEGKNNVTEEVECYHCYSITIDLISWYIHTFNFTMSIELVDSGWIRCGVILC